MGFTNNGAAQSSPLHIDTVYELARRAGGGAARVRARRRRATGLVGAGIGEGLVMARTGGYQSVPPSTEDFLIEVLDANGAPREPRPGAEREALDALRREISVGLRGSARDRFKVVEDGMVLYGAVPHREVAPGAWWPFEREARAAASFPSKAGSPCASALARRDLGRASPCSSRWSTRRPARSPRTVASSCGASTRSW